MSLSGDRSRRGFLWLLGLLAIVVLATLWAVPRAQARPLRGTLVTAVPFPTRTLVLSVPQTVPVQAGQIHITENGHPVTRFTANSLRQANVGDLGVIVVIDSDPSMKGAPLNHAMAAARALAARRTGNQQLGVIFGDGSQLALTTDQRAIDTFLVRPPQIVKATNLLAVTRSAIAELKGANVVAGAVIYVSDDIDKAPGLSVPSLAALATAAHVRIFSVAIKDFATNHPSRFDLPLDSMRQLAQGAGGSFVEAAPAALRRVFTEIETGLTSQYVVRYRSRQPYGHRVNLQVQVDGVPGSFATAYTSPPPFKPAKPGNKQHHETSFWASTTAVVLVTLACAVLFGLAVAFIFASVARTGELKSRVQAFVPEPVAPILSSAEKPTTNTSELISLPRQILEGQRWWPAFVELVDIAGIERSATSLVYLAFAGSLLCVLLLDAITGSLLIALLGLFIGPVLLRLLVRRQARKQRLAFMEQLPGQLHEVAGAMRTGRSISEAIAVVAESADDPVRREFQRAVADERAGQQIEDALRPIGKRMESAEIEQVAVVATLHRRTGANITEVLDRMADTARQRVEIRRELLTLTAQARMSRNVLVSLPIVVVIAIDLIGHQYERPLFHTTAGLFVLALGALMVVIGAQVMKKIVQIEE